MTDVVAKLLDVQVGDEIELAAETYEWGTPFTVTGIEETPWQAAAGDNWTARRIELDAGAPQGKDREFDVVQDGEPPVVAEHYGQLTSVTVVDKNDDVPQQSDEPVTPDRIDEVVDEHRRLEDVAAALGITVGQARVLTLKHGHYSSLTEARNRGRLVVWDGVLVMIVAITVMAVWAIGVILAGGL